MSLYDVETELARRIAAITTTGRPYQQADTDAFRESSAPLSPTREGATRSHLAFAVLTEDAPTEPDRQEAGWEVAVVATVSVLLLYRYRATSYGEDRRAATEAARDVAGAVLAEYDAAGIRIVQAFRPEQIDNEWLRIRITFEAAFSFDIAPRQTWDS